ncbi:MAG: HD family hydrolase [Proteobacteria bacterium]|nr:HD family hydrolase [Pseudomonadota bacterium]
MARAPKTPRAWQRMLSGRRLDLLDPSPLDVEIEDVAHGLARVARWNGQTSGEHIFSVAQHSLLVEAVARQLRIGLPDRTCLAILLHDSAEYVIGDMISPLKAVLNDTYKPVEARILGAVMIRFGLPPVFPRDVATLAKQADGVAAHHEAVELAGFSPAEARTFFGAPVPLDQEVRSLLRPWSADLAKMRFLARFRQLAGEG